ncbi:MAG: hypothetical protein EOR09_13445, partial [Mesorhizobium sp.]
MNFPVLFPYGRTALETVPPHGDRLVLGLARLTVLRKKDLRWLLTVWLGADYIRLTNEGGAPLATK